MRIVLDASVAVAAVRANEPAHRPSRAQIDRVIAQDDEIVVPSLFSIEVAGALSRAGWSLKDIHAYVGALSTPPHRMVTLGPRTASKIRDVAIGCRLRGADACYVWLAVRHALTLCTLDREIASRAGAICAVANP